MSGGFNESVVEEAALEWLRELGYATLPGAAIAPGEPSAERASFADVVLEGRLRSALERLNPTVPAVALDEAYRKLTRPDSASLLLNNRAAHRMLADGVEVEYKAADGSIRGDRVRVLDFTDPAANDLLAVNQFTVAEGGHTRRPDVVVFLNGLPVAVLELKNAADEGATVWAAFNQLQTYEAQVPSLFVHNALLVVSDGTDARLGSLTAARERFLPWKTVDGEALAPASASGLEVLLRGVFEPVRFLDLLRHFVVFEDDGRGQIEKKLAAYHQYHAARAAVQATVRAASAGGDRRGGVVWHTQGSGKSLTMVFYAGKAVLEPALENPTIVVLTDRNDLDDQLFGTFARCADLLRQTPARAEDRAGLRDLLRVASGGVVFTTVQKFAPDASGDAHAVLTDRRNVIAIADEAHRSQYGFAGRVATGGANGGSLEFGYATYLRQALPNATFVGFTGTPIEAADRSTRHVFGDYVSVYDVQRAVEDGATVPIYYEGRLAKLAIREDERPRIDLDFEDVTEGAEDAVREGAKRRWAQLEAMVGTPQRVELVARDLVEHLERRREVLEGKAMVVVMSRRIAVALYAAIRALRPHWHSDDDALGEMKVVMTGSASDPVEFQPHVRNRTGREALAKRLKDPNDPFRLAIVRDMWLTGFDAPSLHTLYVDKPMKGHGLMQAIARVNRAFRDKPGGLVVDYLGIADELRRALSDYADAGGRGRATMDQGEAVAVMLEKLEVCEGLLAGFDRSRFSTGTPAERLSLLPAAREHVLAQDDGMRRYLWATLELSRAFALAVPHEDALVVREDVAFFQAVRAGLAKIERPGGSSAGEFEHAVRQIVSRSVLADEVVDIFGAAGLRRPDVSVLSDEFLAEVQGLEHKNLAFEALKRLLNDEIRLRSRSNVVQARLFSEMLDATIRRYQNRGIETARVLQELVDLARAMREAQARGEQLGLSDDELAFYDALEVNDSAVRILGDEQLREIARELVRQVKANVSIDWTVRESVRARLRAIVRRVLRRYGYPPDRTEAATVTILRQAEMLAGTWDA